MKLPVVGCSIQCSQKVATKKMARNMDMSDSKELGVEVGSVENALQA